MKFRLSEILLAFLICVYGYVTISNYDNLDSNEKRNPSAKPSDNFLNKQVF